MHPSIQTNTQALQKAARVRSACGSGLWVGFMFWQRLVFAISCGALRSWLGWLVGAVFFWWGGFFPEVWVLTFGGGAWGGGSQLLLAFNRRWLGIGRSVLAAVGVYGRMWGVAFLVWLVGGCSICLVGGFSPEVWVQIFGGGHGGGVASSCSRSIGNGWALDGPFWQWLVFTIACGALRSWFACLVGAAFFRWGVSLSCSVGLG